MHYSPETIIARQGLGDLVCYEKPRAATDKQSGAAIITHRRSAVFPSSALGLLPPLQRLRKGLLATAALYELLSTKLKWLSAKALEVELGVRTPISESRSLIFQGHNGND